MREINEPELSHIIADIDRCGEDIYAVIEFIGGVAYWLDCNVPGTRQPPEKAPDED